MVKLEDTPGSNPGGPSKGCAGSNPAVGTMRCCACKDELPVDQFSFKNKKTGRRNTRCKACQKAYAAEHYKNNSDAYKVRATKSRPELRTRSRAWVQAYKTGSPCTDCGGVFHHAAMDFDHIHPGKVANVAVLAAEGASLKKLRDEIAKCDLVCSNCHRIRTFKRMHGGTHGETV